MAINLLEMLSSQIGGSQYSQIGKFLGADERVAKKAMGAALPTVLGSLINNGSSTSGAAGIMNMLNKGNFDGSMLDNLGGLFGGGNATSSLMNSGSSVLNSLLGNKLGSVVDMIGSYSGMKKSNSSSLMSMAAPLVMSMLGRYVKNKALDASGLSSFLGTQKKHVAAALPAGMGNILGFDAGTVTNAASAATGRATAAANTGRAAVAETASAGGGILSKILPLALIALLAGGAYWFFTNNSPVDALSDATSGITEGATNLADKAGDMAGDAAGAVKDGAAATADAAGNMVDKAGDMAGNAMDATTKAAREALGNVKFAAGSAGEKFNNFLAGGAEGDESFRFNNLNFAVGSANISGETTEVDNLAAVLKGYPNVKIEVAGYTDSTGDAGKNKTLSQSRADAVQARLIAQGIDADRISTMGYGADNPVASNDTKEGRAENRRIEIKVTEK